MGILDNIAQGFGPGLRIAAGAMDPNVYSQQNQMDLHAQEMDQRKKDAIAQVLLHQIENAPDEGTAQRLTAALSKVAPQYAGMPIGRGIQAVKTGEEMDFKNQQRAKDEEFRQYTSTRRPMQTFAAWKAQRQATPTNGQPVALDEGNGNGMTVQGEFTPFDDYMMLAQEATAAGRMDDAKRFEALAGLEEKKQARQKETQVAALLREQSKYEPNTPEWQKYEQRLLKINPIKQEQMKVGMNKGKREYFYLKDQVPIWTGVEAPDSAPIANINLNNEKNFFGELAKGAGEDITKSNAEARNAARAITIIHDSRASLDKGAFTGFGANVALGFGRILSQAGFDAAKDPVANTQAYASNIGNLVGQVIKQFGSGTGLSDADRQYAMKIAGGDMTLDEGALRKLLDIHEKANRAIIQQHNQKAKQIDSAKEMQGVPYKFSVEEPPSYVSPTKKDLYKKYNLEEKP